MTSQSRQFDTRGCRFLAGRCRLFGDITYVQYAAGNFLGDGALLLSCGRDLLVHALDGRDGERDVFQGTAGPTAQFDTAVRKSAAIVEGGHHLLGAVLQGSDQLFDLFGGLLGALRQAAHLVRDHCETTARFPGACGFDGSVQGQQIGLLRH